MSVMTSGWSRRTRPPEIAIDAPGTLVRSPFCFIAVFDQVETQPAGAAVGTAASAANSVA
jgi:hypothetical protein